MLGVYLSYVAGTPVPTPVPPRTSATDLTFQRELGPAPSQQTCPVGWALSRTGSPAPTQLWSPRSAAVGCALLGWCCPAAPAAP